MAQLSPVITAPSYETHMTHGIEFSQEEAWAKISRNLGVM